MSLGNEKISERKNTQLPYLVIACSSSAFKKIKNDIAYTLYRLKAGRQKRLYMVFFAFHSFRYLLSKLLNERQLLLSFPLKQRN